MNLLFINNLKKENGDKVVHLGDKDAVLHADSILNNNFVLVSLIIERRSIFLHNFRVRGAVHAFPVLEPLPFLQVVVSKVSNGLTYFSLGEFVVYK